VIVKRFRGKEYVFFGRYTLRRAKGVAIKLRNMGKSVQLDVIDANNCDVYIRG